MDSFVIHYFADGQVNFLSTLEKDESYTVAFSGEGFGLVDADRLVKRGL